MTAATLRIAGTDLVATFDDPAIALAKAQRIRDEHPELDVVLEFDVPAEDVGEIPQFLRSAALARAARRNSDDGRPA
jgi:hypothetical protein